MKSIALMTVWLVLLLISPAAFGQGMRGGFSRGFAGSMSNGGAVVQSRQGGISIGQIVPGRNFAIAPSSQFQGVPLLAAPQVFAPRPFSNVILTPGPFVSGRPFIALGAVPHHLHYPWFFQRYPGIVILDEPFVPATTVITQIAPGVVREERRDPEPPLDEPRARITGQLAPFDPTPQEVVERILSLAAIKPRDVLYDLGSGDGRVIITAAKKYGIKAVGFEIDPGLVKLARENARKQGVEKLVEFRQQDFLSANLSAASIVTLYLSYDGNLALRRQLMHQLKPGARVLSYTFDMGEWQPKIAEAYRDTGGDQHMIYLWQIGEPLAFR